MAAASTERGGGAVPATALTVLGIGIVAAAVAHDVRFGTGQLMVGVVAMPGILLLAGLVYILWSSLDAATYWTVARWVFGGLVTLGGGVAVVIYLGGDLSGTGVESLGRTTLQVLFFSGLGTVGGLLVGLQSVRAVEEARRAEEARTNALMYAAERDRLSQLSETSLALLESEEGQRVADLLADGIERAIPDATCAVWLTGRSGLEPAVDGTPAAPDIAGSEGFADARERIVSAPDAGKRFYVPLAEHGLLSVTLPTGQEFDDRGLDLVRVYARTGQTALDRAAHQEALERQNERLDEFASVVSHDLRNPLSVIMGRAELARETGDTEHLDAVVDNAERMDRLIEDVLTLARQGEDATERERVRLHDAALAAWSAVSNADACVDIDEALPTISGDREQLQRMFENLFRNSVEHGGETVSIRVEPLGDTGCAVVDDGPGIPPENRDRVFERGYSTDGTGLGLAIVTDIVDGHDGSISVTEGDAGGARFEIRDLGVLTDPLGSDPTGGADLSDREPERPEDREYTDEDGNGNRDVDESHEPVGDGQTDTSGSDTAEGERNVEDDETATADAGETLSSGDTVF